MSETELKSKLYHSHSGNKVIMGKRLNERNFDKGYCLLQLCTICYILLKKF